MDDRDIEQLRAFRIDEATPPAGLQARIEEQLWQAILVEESAKSLAAKRGQRRWFESLVRPAVAAGSIVMIAAVVAVASDGGAASSGAGDAVTGASTGVRQAGLGLFDSTASSMFGSTATNLPERTPIAGTIDLRSSDAEPEQLVLGPTTQDGVLDEGSAEFAFSASRDLAGIRTAVRAAVAASIGDDPGGSAAFDVTMRWIVAPAVPGDLRAAMLRSLDVVGGIDPATVSSDALGRSSIVIGHVDLTTGLRTQYLLSPRDGSLLERREFTTTYMDPACPSFTFVEYALYDDAGMQLDAADTPWLAWPPVIEACDPGVRSQ